MTVLLTAHGLSKSYGTQILFQNISFTISQGERIGLIGPNGNGKSTLFKILMGIESPDEGSLSRRQGLRVGYASQSPEFPAVSLEDILVEEGMPGDETELLTRARILLGKAQFPDGKQLASTFSGGWKKRLDIVRALMRQPDLLLLDEPTNHLDLEGILWLEKFLMRENITYVVISHDRYFLENISGKVIELNRCYPQGLFVSKGNMSNFMDHRTAFLEGQLQQERELAAAVKNEIDWLRRSPKARTTKSQSRIQRAYGLIEELSEVKRRNKVQKVDIAFSASERETRKLIVAKNLGKTLGGKQLFKGIDLTLSPGSRIGIVGKNGTGKTTLLKVLGKIFPPDVGTIKYADDLKLVYFDQHREHLPPYITLKEALAPTSDIVYYRGQSIHVNGWAKKFLFSPERLALPISRLSGGERARILIARLMLEPADVLFLDEPTNDLDIQTLEIIEESFTEFEGAIVLISHDRCFMDRICTEILGLGENNEQTLFADYAQWEQTVLQAGKKEKITEKSVVTPAAPIAKAKKLSYHEQKELEGMEKNILAAEAEVEELHDQINQQAGGDVQKIYTLLDEAQQKLDALYQRWQLLLDKGSDQGGS
jgi:ATP-binding cassette subfamily F protein uup